MLTGETGAGKSILLDALSLALGGARRRGARARRRRAGRCRRRSSTPPADHPGRALLARQRHRRRGRPDPPPCAGRATARAAPSSTTSRCRSICCASVGAVLVEIHGQHDDRALVERERTPPPARRLWRARARGAGGRGGVIASWRERGSRGRRACAAKCASAEAEADYLRAAVDELADARARSPARKTALAERRQPMMRARSSPATSSRPTRSSPAARSPIPTLAAPRPPAGAEGPRGGRACSTAIAAALDRALVALRGGETRAARRRSPRRASIRTNWSGPRSGCSRSAPRRGNTHVAGRPTCPRLPDALSARLAELDPGAERLGARAAAPAERAHATDERAGALSQQARDAAARSLEKAVDAELPALKLERGEFIVV